MAVIAHTAHKDKLAIHRLGLWLFIISDSFLFLGLLFSRFYLQGVRRPPEINQPLGLAISIVLILSSLAAYRGETAAAYGDIKRFRRNILLTLGLGALFLVGVGLEWSEAFRSFPPSTGYGTIFFTLTGFHAFHVVTGLLALTVALLPGQRARLQEGNSWGVEAVVKYWHFVDVAWVFIFPTLYLVS
ncbi:MAG: heme-copper oxidase subunit III [Chloroflexi bacterium]|nr:heme-copper oxidase subunit III [Chloroflexota bacterium]